MDIDLRVTDGPESMKTQVSRMTCENRLGLIYVKYNISAADMAVLVEGVAEYLQVQDDAYEDAKHW